MKLIHSLISLEEGWRPHLPSKSLCASSSQVSPTSSARANVNAFRHVGQTKSQPHPHQGQSICAGAPITVCAHEQCEIRSLLALTRYRILVASTFGIAVFDLPHPNAAQMRMSTPAPMHGGLSAQYFMRTILLAFTSCTWPCTIDFRKVLCFRLVMKADLRISIKDYQRNKNLKILLFRPPFPCRGFYVRMNDAPWPASGEPVCLSRLMAALRKSLVRAGHGAGGCG